MSDDGACLVCVEFEVERLATVFFFLWLLFAFAFAFALLCFAMG